LVAAGTLDPARTSHDAYAALFGSAYDVGASLVKVLVLGVLVVAIHCYHGWTAGHGGQAVALAVRTAAVVIVVADAAFGLVIWADAPTMRLAG
jgi:phospholipid/cholesterol/gamma-HCH transport system permease protein